VDNFVVVAHLELIYIWVFFPFCTKISCWKWQTDLFFAYFR